MSSAADDWSLEEVRPAKKMRVEERAGSPGATSETFDDTEDFYAEVQTSSAVQDGEQHQDQPLVLGPSEREIARQTEHNNEDHALMSGSETQPAEPHSQHPEQLTTAAAGTSTDSTALGIDSAISNSRRGTANGEGREAATTTDDSGLAEAPAGSAVGENLPSTALSSEVQMQEQAAGSAKSDEQDTGVDNRGDRATEAATNVIKADLLRKDGQHEEADEEFVRAAAANHGDENAEWELDSQADDSDSDSSDSDSSDDDAESEANDYDLLSPEEQARILMAEEGGGSDDEGKQKKPGARSGPRTVHEVAEEKIHKPDVTVTPEMEVIELGDATSIVENYLLVKGTTSGDTQVLDAGSVLCLADRTVIGAVAEPLGRVDTPMYSVAFTNAEEMVQAGVTLGTKIYYVKDHSTYVFTQPLKLLKGTDASNLYDEEVGDEEIEFSDDEAEAAYKRQKKQEKLARKGVVPKAAGDRMGSGSYRPASYPDAPMRYDDGDDDFYTPLSRNPGSGPPMPPTGFDPRKMTGNNRGSLTDRGRGGRGRGDRGRGDRGRGRGGRDRGGGRQPSHPSYVNFPNDQGSPPGLRALPLQSQYADQQQAQPYPGMSGMQWNQTAQMGSFPQMAPAFAPPAGSFVNPNFFRNTQSGAMPPQGGYGGQQQFQSGQQQPFFPGQQQSPQAFAQMQYQAQQRMQQQQYGQQQAQYQQQYPPGQYPANVYGFDPSRQRTG